MLAKAKFSQSGIKNENTLAIFSAIVASDGISRSEISERTGLSLMTVGKVADNLTHQGILCQVKPATGNAGRRAGMLTVSEEHFILTLDISAKRFTASASGLTLVPFDTIAYQYNDSLFPEDNLIIFFRETCSLLMKHLMKRKLVGMGICVPGKYDPESDTVHLPRIKEIEGIRISENAKKSIGILPDIIINSAEATALAAISELPKEKRGCIISISLDGGISGCISLEDEVLSRPADFASLSCQNGRSLLRNLSEIADEEELCREISSALRPIVSVLCPDSVFVCSAERRFSEWFPSLLCEGLKTPVCAPNVFFENIQGSRAETGLAGLLRNDMIKNL